MTALFAWTDGACSGNPGPGGWGAVLRFGEHQKELYGAEKDTTNNRMELMAAISALEALTRPTEITVTTDSAYVKNGVTQWIHGWKRNGWKTADNKPVKNADLWVELETQTHRHDVAWHWVKGHAGHALNEEADRLANGAARAHQAGRTPEPGPGFAGAVVSDIRLPGASGLDVLAQCRERVPDVPVILVTGHADVELAVSALKDGVYDFISKPFDIDRLTGAVGRAARGVEHARARTASIGAV